MVRIEGGTLRIGPGDWEAQGVVTPREAAVAPFGLDAFEVTEERWAACVARGTCAPIPLSGEPGRAVAGVSLAEARVFCRAAGGDLPSADQLAFAAATASGRRYPWGDTGAVCRRAAWGLTEGPCGEGATGPEVAGSHPDGAATPGVFDLAGNVAEWTRPAEDTATAAEVRGGSYADTAAAALRSWSGRPVAVGARAPEIGFRCVYP